HQLASTALECRVREIGVGPLDEDRLAVVGSECGVCGRDAVTRRVQAGKVLIVWHVRSRQRRIFEMDRVEPAVAGIFGVEFEADKPARQELVYGEMVKDALFSLQPVEV